MVDGPPKQSVTNVASGVTRIAEARLTVGSEAWPYAAQNAAEIETHWRTATAANPRYFNGVIYLTRAARLSDESLDLSLLRTDFKSYLYWRACGFPKAGVLDGFGSGLIRTEDGDIILGRQRSGNVNAGLVYLPSGFIDQSDVDARGEVDVTRGVLREISEETGVTSDAFRKDPGFLIARDGAQLSLAVPLHVAMTTAAFLTAASAHIATSRDSELEAVIAVSKRTEIADLPLPPYTRILLEALLA